MEIPQSLSAFLAFMGTPVFSNWVASEILEQQAWFQKLPSGRKSLVVLAISIILGVVSFALVTWTPASVVTNLQPLYAVIVASVAGFLSGQYYHAKAHAEDTPAGVA